MATLEKQKELGREVAAYFTRNPGIEFVGFAGVGRHGGALILAQKNSEGQLQRKLVIKYSLGGLTGDPDSNADEDLRNEFYWLQRLRGAEHIVRLVPFADCSLKIPGMSDGEKTQKDSDAKGKQRDDALKNQVKGGGDGGDKSKTKGVTWRARKCPTFALEYLPNGQLSDTIEKLKVDKRLIPNRILWRIWLCLVRQCVAMAFPPCLPVTGEEDDERTIREQLINDQQYCTLTQNSPHLENWLWGSGPTSGAPDEDHDPGIPLVKMIDFGRGKLEDLKDYVDDELDDLQECGSRTNLWHAAIVMAELCLPLDNIADLRPSHEFEYQYKKEGEAHTVMTFAPGPLRFAEEMDLRLRDILVRCMAGLPGHIPPLREVLAEAERAVATIGPNDNPDLAALMNVREDDRYLRSWVQRYIYDAFWADDASR
ncbi:hypothetical protein F5Y12DRAFT_710418 [Xylaria sp. FL1777]|nr:hypothetical protein F5Y12DRAFT_710418 [Xylaria sp. FL1777]